MRGLSIPYRINENDGTKIYVIDGAGAIREANRKEINELRTNKRG
jgi:hypothetical protein